MDDSIHGVQSSILSIGPAKAKLAEPFLKAKRNANFLKKCKEFVLKAGIFPALKNGRI